MRTMLAIAALCFPVMTMAQITSSENSNCTISRAGMACRGSGGGIQIKVEEQDRPTLYVSDMRLDAGASLDDPNALSDYLILGVNGGDLLNEKTPLRHVSLDKGSVTLMPRGKPFRLRNNGSDTVEFQLIEIRR